MTYKEAINKSMMSADVFPIAFPMFVQSLASILVKDAEARLKRDEPELELSGKHAGGGNAIESPNVNDVCDVLIGNDLLRNGSQFTQLHGFLEWLMRQEAPTGERFWTEFETVAGKWNEYANERKAE